MNDIAKAIATASIWVSTSITLSFGLFEMRLSGWNAMSVLVTLTLFILLAATISTAKIWKSHGDD